MNLSPLFWTLSLLAVIVIIFLALGARAKDRLKRQYPPTGQMIDVDTYHLHMQVEGEGTPTVVLDAGAGGIGLSWELVRPAIAKVTCVVAYDRAGLGWSDPSTYPRDAVTMAGELHTLLINAKIPSPYILVGHSLGGAIARQFAAKYPNEVVGLVMVDSVHEYQMKYLPEAFVKKMNSMKSMMTILRRMSRLGVFALKPDLITIGDNGKLSRDLVAQMRGVVASSPSHADALVAEIESASAMQVQPVSTLGDLPLTVISHRQPDPNIVPTNAKMQMGYDYELAWQKLQEEIASLSTRGKHIVAEKSGHNIIYDQPEIIIDAILEMLHTPANPTT